MNKESLSTALRMPEWVEQDYLGFQKQANNILNELTIPEGELLIEKLKSMLREQHIEPAKIFIKWMVCETDDRNRNFRRFCKRQSIGSLKPEKKEMKK